MNKLRWLSLLMVVTILGITGFQAYWLKENYDREKNSLLLKSQFHFRETMLNLQVDRLNLPGIPDSGRTGSVKLVMKGDRRPVSVRFRPRNEVVSTINVIREKVKDSLQLPRKPFVIAMDKTSVNMSGDSINVDRQMMGEGPNHLISLLYGVDSLQDSIRVHEIDSVLSIALAGDELDIPFSIRRTGEAEAGPPEMNKVTVGIRNPVTYEMVLGNTFPYLVKKITLPILFSLLLLGITITSFVLLYRNFVKQKRLADLKNEFISNITHELKTPIATVSVAIEALKNFNAIEDPAKTTEYLDISSNELQRLGLLVDKVLKLSMFEKKDMGIKAEPLDLGQLTDEVVTSLRLQFEKSGAEEVQLHKDGNLQMEGDRLHLLSVIFNLVDNALKYSTGKPRVIINVKEKEDKVELLVSDQGIGIPAVYKGKIFEKFFRVPQGNTHNAKGYGLGLSYVSHVVKKHNGAISVNDNPGGGTIFSVSLPKKQS